MLGPEVPPLNPMVFCPRFLHIAEQIFEHLDNKSLKNCREVAKSWQECIDDRNILWIRIVEAKGGNAAFQSACRNGHSKIAEMLMQNSAEFHIYLNVKDEYGWTAFHFGCDIGKY